jgi:excinuclease ABC subunit B
MDFKLKADYQPTGDQPQAIEKLTAGTKANLPAQVLVGVTGSGKTYTVANVIEKVQKPTLVISHNKTLAAQLYQEFKEYFPDNAVSYFVSYYDYYQPEAYIPQTDTYIAKDADINEEIDKLRLFSTSQIFSRKDVIVVASVSCIYNIGSPDQYRNRILHLFKGQELKREDFLYSLVSLYYQRSRLEFSRGFFRIRGEIVEIYPSYSDEIIKITWEGNKVVGISSRPVIEGEETQMDNYFLYPAKHYLADKGMMEQAFKQIRADLKIRLEQFKKEGRDLEANRLNQRVNYDLEMIKEVGYVNGIENYSRYFDGRLPGEPPYSLLDYFKHQYGNDFLVVIDESHMTVPQIRGMHHGDQSRKRTLIDFGFRLPSALDNRPLNFQEFLKRVPQAIFVSATPDDWEVDRARSTVQSAILRQSSGQEGKGRSHDGVVEQLIRPTGLVDPEVEVRPIDGQVKDLIKEILARKKKGERVLVTTLTKRMAEDLSSYLADPEHTDEPMAVHYLHADVDTLKRTDILADLRRGTYDVIVGINLLREGLDLPEVSLVAILDADKQGFLRSKVSLIQTMGRAARNVAGKVILYADFETQAMKEALTEVARRRKVQVEYNEKHGIIPQTIQKPIREALVIQTEEEPAFAKALAGKGIDMEALTPADAKKLITKLKKQMREYAKLLEFERAAQVRNKIENLRKRFDLE